MILNQKLLEGRDSICLTLEYLGIEDVDKYLLTECVQYKHSWLNWNGLGSSVQFSCSVMSDSVTPWTAVHQASLSITSSWRLFKLMSIESVMPSNHFILSYPLILLPSIFPSIRVFSSESVLCIRWSKYWSFSFSIGPSNEYSGLISLRIHWFDLLAVEGTLKSLLYHHNLKASILRCSVFFMVQLAHPYMTTGKSLRDYVNVL